MKLLLDTHALAWWLLDDRRLSRRARQLAMDPGNEVWISAVSAFEMATKYRLGKWSDVRELAMNFEAAIAEEGFGLLAITVRHASRGGLMLGVHRDPFDRLLAAQASIEAMPIVTNDPAFRALGVETLW